MAGRLPISDGEGAQMPGIGGVGDNATNETVSSNNLISAAGSLAISLASAIGAIEVAKLAQNQGSIAIATGKTDNPVTIVPGAQVQYQQQQVLLQQQQQKSYVVIAVAGVLTLLVVLAVVRAGRGSGG